MKKYLFLLLFVGGLSIPVFSDSLTVLGGYDMPEGNSDIYDQNERETTFRTKDLNDFGAAFRYDHFLGDFVNVGFSASFYDSSTRVEDLDFQFADGRPVRRRISLQEVPLEFNVHVLPTGREAQFIPYFGGGFGFYYWQYEERGDFINNRLTDPTPITGRSFSDGTDPGWHVEGGFQIPVSRSATFTAEAKYWKANGDLDKASFDPRFEPIDLSATMISAGVSFWF